MLGDHGDEPGAAVLYAVTMALTVLASVALSTYASTHDLIDPEVPRALVRHGHVRGIATAVVFLLSVPIALAFGAQWGEYFWALLIPLEIGLRRAWHGNHEMSW